MARNHFKTTDLLENRQNHGCNHLETWTTLGTRQHPVVHQSDHTCHKLAPVSVYLSVSSTKIIKVMAQQLVVFEGWMWMLSIYRFIKGYWGPQGSPTNGEVPVGRTQHHSTWNTDMAKVTRPATTNSHSSSHKITSKPVHHQWINVSSTNNPIRNRFGYHSADSVWSPWR